MERIDENYKENINAMIYNFQVKAECICTKISSGWFLIRCGYKGFKTWDIPK
jgi:hypothetical protein